jgi:glycosyltransferase involved in cell wall biosynthesis
MRLLIVTPRYFPEAGGVEEHVAQIARRAAEREWPVTVLTTSLTSAVSERREGVEIVRVPAWPRNGDVRVAPSIPRVVAERRWDLMHLQSFHTAVAPLAMLAALATRLPYVVTFHSGGHSSSVRQWLRPLQRRSLSPLLRRARRLIPVSQRELDVFSHDLRLPASRFELIPNGVDPPPPPAARPSVEPAPYPLLASIGRLERYKGHQHVIAALPLVLETHPDAVLWVAGHGPYEGELRAQAESLGVAERVRFEPVPPGERALMAARLAQSDVVVLMSDFETHPLAALEAISVGRRLVVADSPGLAELADEGLASRVPMRADAPTVARAIVESLASPAPAAGASLPTCDD